MPSQIHIHRRSALLSSQGQGQLVYRLHKRLSGEAANLFLRLHIGFAQVHIKSVLSKRVTTKKIMPLCCVNLVDAIKPLM